MLDRDVERRIAIQAVLEHPWTTFIDEEEDETDASENGPTRDEIVKRDGKGKSNSGEGSGAVVAA